MRTIVRTVAIISLYLLSLLGGGSASAGSYPDRTVRIIVVYPPGGGLDLVMRAIAKKLSEYWKQPVIIENRGGGATTIGTAAGAKAEPNGYTILSTDVSFSITATLFKNLQYDPVKDFEPVALVAGVSNVMVVHPSVPATDVKEFIAYARSGQKKLRYATGGSGTLPNLAMVTFMQDVNITMDQIPYRGSGGSMTSMIAGVEDVYIGALGTVYPYIKAGKLRPLAVLDSRRSKLIPDVPTITEAGLPHSQARSWYGLFLPAKTDRAIVDKIAADAKRAVGEPEVQRVIETLGDDPDTMGPDEFRAFLKENLKKWGEAVHAAGVQVE